MTTDREVLAERLNDVYRSGAVVPRRDGLESTNLLASMVLQPKAEAEVTVGGLGAVSFSYRDERV